MKPLVSVVIPSYNRASVLPKSVQSVLNQSYSALECIVVDDGSTDDTKQVLEQIPDPRLRYVYQENAGACAARNKGVAHARGDYIAFHDSDDTWHVDKLEKQMRVLMEKRADVVICKLNYILPDGSTRLIPKRIPEGFVSPTADLLGTGTQTLVVRKEVLAQEPFDVEMPRLQDFEWMYRVRKRFQIYCVAEGLVDYRVGDDSISTSHEKRYRAQKRFLEQHPEVRREQPFLCMHMMKDLAESWLSVRKTEPKESGQYLRLMLRYYPGILRFVKSAVEQRRD